MSYLPRKGRSLTIMDILRYTPQGRIDRTSNLSMHTANALYERDAWMAEQPFARYYRLVLVDTMRGDYVVRDTDHEVFGRQNMGRSFAPGNRFGWEN